DADRPAHLRAQAGRDRAVEAGERAPAGGGRALSASYSRPYLAHGSIGPSTALARFEKSVLNVWSASQNVFALRGWIARTLGLDPANVVVHHAQGAGCYGHNPADDAAFDAAYVATLRPGRTVRAQWSRRDELAADAYGPAASVRVEAVLDGAGRPADWTFELWSAAHGQRPGSNGVANLIGAEALPDAAPPPKETSDPVDPDGGGAMRNARALYDLPHQRILHHLLEMPAVRTSSLRGLGTFMNLFSIECFIDELAEAAGEDPLAYRLALTADPRARRVLETAAAMAGWVAGAPAGTGTGRGIAFGRYKNQAGYMAIVAEVQVDDQVSFRRAFAAVDAGLLVNPDGAANQIEGGIVQAASWALKEQVRFEGGSSAALDWDRYPILRFSEVPEIEIRFVGEPHQPPLGLGEVAQGPTAGALGNAVAHALGARIRDLPLTRARIMDALLA
ncbi:molybdopterin cofactor-binding domain-containing protein, partial [Propylenella binzhouense]